MKRFALLSILIIMPAMQCFAQSWQEDWRKRELDINELRSKARAGATDLKLSNDDYDNIARMSLLSDLIDQIEFLLGDGSSAKLDDGDGRIDVESAPANVNDPEILKASYAGWKKGLTNGTTRHVDLSMLYELIELQQDLTKATGNGGKPVTIASLGKLMKTVEMIYNSAHDAADISERTGNADMAAAAMWKFRLLGPYKDSASLAAQIESAAAAAKSKLAKKVEEVVSPKSGSQQVPLIKNVVPIIETASEQNGTSKTADHVIVAAYTVFSSRTQVEQPSRAMNDVIGKGALGAISILALIGVTLGLTGKAIFYMDNTDLGMSLAAAVITPFSVLIGIAMGNPYSYVGILVALLFAVHSFSKSFQFNSNVFVALCIWIAKLLFSFVYLLHILSLIEPSGKTVAARRHNRAGAFIIGGLMTAILPLLVNGERVRASRKSSNRAGNAGRNDQEGFQKDGMRGAFSYSEFQSQEERYAQILGLSGHFGGADIKRAYHEMLAKYHPDKVDHLGDEFQKIASEKTMEIISAYKYFQKKFGLA